MFRRSRSLLWLVWDLRSLWLLQPRRRGVDSINGYAADEAPCDALTAEAALERCPYVVLFPYAERSSLSQHKGAKWYERSLPLQRRAQATSAQSCRRPQPTATDHRIDTITGEVLPR